MREKIQSQLKAYLQTLGVKNLSKERQNTIVDRLSQKVTEESEIETKLEELNEFMDFAQIAKTDDRLRTLEAKNQPAPPPAPTPEPAPADDLSAKLAEMQAKLEAFEKQQAQQRLHQTFTQKAKEKKLPEQLLKGKIIESEEQLEATLQEIESDYTALKQSLINEGLSQQTGPQSGITATPAASVLNDINAWASKDK